MGHQYKYKQGGDMSRFKKILIALTEFVAFGIAILLQAFSN